MILRVGTRGSPLALAQTGLVTNRLIARFPQLEIEVVRIKTRGDADQISPLGEMGTSLFVKELERALMSGEIDFAVHSLKDLPFNLPAGLVLAAVPERVDPRDALILNPARPGRVRSIGTGSPRRRMQLSILYPGARFLELRGNVESRIKKMGGLGLDAIALAAAGLCRMGLSSRISRRFEPLEVVPSPGQGALAVEARAGDGEVLKLLSEINDGSLYLNTALERLFARECGQDCHTPVGACCLDNEFYAFLGHCASGAGVIKCIKNAGESEVVSLAADLRGEIYGVG